MKTSFSLILVFVMSFLGILVVEAGSQSPLVFGVKWSGDGRWIAAHSNQGIWLFDTENPEENAQVFLEGENISDVEFDPSSHFLVAASSSYETGEGIVKVIELETGEVIQELYPDFSSEDSMAVIYDLDFSADGENLIVANTSLLYVYDFASGEEITVNQEMTFTGDYGSSHWITSVDELDEDEIFLASNWNGDLFVIDEDGVQDQFKLEGTEYSLYAIEALAENHFLVHSGNAILDWQIEGETSPLIEASEDSFITGFSYRAETEEFLYGTNGLIGLYDIESGETVLEISLENEDLRSFSFDFNPLGTQFVSLQTDGSIIVWDSETGEKIYSLGNFENAVSYKWG